jgi:DNA-binding NarL/FixJ family response regulator
MLTMVLVVDDDDGFRSAARRLAEAGEEITVVGEATSGDGAVELVRALRPHVVLMDLVMPGINGLEATRRIKGEWPEAKVIILTVHDEDGYRKAADESGADAFIVKKALTDHLVPVIRRLAGASGDSSRWGVAGCSPA